MTFFRKDFDNPILFGAGECVIFTQMCDKDAICIVCLKLANEFWTGFATRRLHKFIHWKYNGDDFAVDRI